MDYGSTRSFMHSDAYFEVSQVCRRRRTLGPGASHSSAQRAHGRATRARDDFEYQYYDIRKRPDCARGFRRGRSLCDADRRSKRVETGRVDAIVTDSRVFSKIVPTVAFSDANAAVTNVGGGYIFRSGDIQSSRRRRFSYCKYV